MHLRSASRRRLLRADSLLPHEFSQIGERFRRGFGERAGELLDGHSLDRR